MASITANTGGTLKSNSAEAALIELAVFLRNNEKISAKNPSNFNYISVDFSGISFNCNISFRIPVQSTIDNNGGLLLTATEYLSNLGFNTGTGGTLKSSTAAQTFIELINFLQAKESNPESNVDDKNLIISQFSTDDKIFSGSAVLPITFTSDNLGKISIVAVEYLQ